MSWFPVAFLTNYAFLVERFCSNGKPRRYNFALLTTTLRHHSADFALDENTKNILKLKIDSYLYTKFELSTWFMGHVHFQLKLGRTTLKYTMRAYPCCGRPLVTCRSAVKPRVKAACFDIVRSFFTNYDLIDIHCLYRRLLFIIE